MSQATDSNASHLHERQINTVHIHILRGAFIMKTLASLIAVLLAVSPWTTAEATTVSAGSGLCAAGIDAEDGSATWRFSDPTAADTITWTSGINHADGTAYAKNPFGPEPKFNTVPVLAGRIYAGFADNDGAGPAGSTTTTFGTGNGALVEGTLWGTNAVATWSVTATGALGLPTIDENGTRVLPSWDSTAAAKDPYNILQSQLDDLGITGSVVDLFFPVGLTGGNLTVSSSAEILGAIALNASYEDTSGSTEIIDILIDSSGATVTGSNAATFYLLSSLDEGPTEIPSRITSLADIQALLNNDVLSDLSIDSPLFLGVVLEDMPIPTTTLSNGALARIHVDTVARDADALEADAVVPEPHTWVLLISGLIGIGVLSRRLGIGVLLRRLKYALPMHPSIGQIWGQSAVSH